MASERSAQVGLGGFWHETNSFSPWRTGLDSFAGATGAVLRGRGKLQGRLESDAPIAGFVRAVEERGYSAVPVLDAFATPSGTITRDAYRAIGDELVTGLLSVEPAAALLVSLHGAAVADGTLDPEGDIVTRLRRGRKSTPIGVVLDHHAGVSEELVVGSDLVVGYKTEPHIDTAACGAKAAEVIIELVEGRLTRIDRCFVRLPLLLPIENLLTTRGPLSKVMALAEQLSDEHQQDVIDISVFPGFAYSDSPVTGASVLVHTHANPQLAKQLAIDLADELWDRRSEFWVPVVQAQDAVDQALRSTRLPVVLIDKADHPGAGGVGDSSLLLRLLCEREAASAVAGPIHDPPSVQRAVETGVGESATFRIGGVLTGEAFETEARVRLVADGSYDVLGPVDHGARMSIGRSAVLEIGGVEAVVCEGRSGLSDPELLRRLGIEPTRRQILCMKALGTFRAAFEPIIGETIMVEGEGAALQSLASLEYRYVQRPIEPLDDDVDFRSSSAAQVVLGRDRGVAL